MLQKGGIVLDISKLFDLSGKIAVITGASKGLGKDIAKLLATAGSRVAIVARDKEKLEAAAHELEIEGYDVLPLVCDLSKVEGIPMIMKQVYDHFGQIDILINNAGLNIPKPAEEVTEKDWDAILDINLKSAFFCSQAAGRYMVQRNQGKIVNVSSQMAFVGYYNRSAYCASKGGLTQMTRALAIEWAKHRINVNAIAPTFIETPMTESMFCDPDFREEVISRIPLGRLAKVEDLYGAMLYLSSHASDMVTGQTIVVDGGWTVW